MRGRGVSLSKVIDNVSPERKAEEEDALKTNNHADRIT